MKIENSGMSPISSKPTEAAKRVEKKNARKDVEICARRTG